MKETDTHQPTLTSYPVWDRPVRIFHWINTLSIMALIFIGLAILYNKDLGVSSDGKILLKTIHVYFGYVFVINLICRFIWSFLGNKYSTWQAISPFSKQYRTSLSTYMLALKSKTPVSYAGHNPVARLMVLFLFLLISSQAITGLILAGTDLYMPPFGNNIAAWVAEDPANLASISPASKDNINPEKYKEMRAFRKPVITTHVYVFYLLLGAVFLHILGVVVAEVKEKSGLVSAMFTGNKVFSEKPVDFDNQKQKKTQMNANERE